MKKTFLSLQELGKYTSLHHLHITENSSFTKRILVIVFCCLFAIGKSNAQIINEGFEESQWSSNSITTSGSVSVSGTVSTMTYYINSRASSSSLSCTAPYTGTFESSVVTSNSVTSFTAYYLSLTSSGLNTSPNSGTWWYSGGRTTTDIKLSRAHSVKNGWMIASNGYLITPVISSGIVTVSFWAGGTTGNTFIGVNTATNNPPPSNYRSISTSNGFTSGVSSISISSGSGMNSYSYSTLLTGPVQLGLFNAIPGSIYIDDIMVSIDPGTQASVITNSATPSQTSLQVTGTIVANTPTPNAMVNVSGICYSLSSVSNNPDTSNSKTTDGPNSVISGSITSTIKGLLPNTNYSVRAYAITSAGIVYGNTLSAKTTAPTSPIITTNAVTLLSSSSVQCGGNISDSGGLKITSSGVCWSTTSSPTVANNKTVDGNSTSYTSTINGLLPCTQYYVRAYAVNANGTSYGNELNFTTACVPTLSCNPSLLNFGSIPVGTYSTTLSFTLMGSLLSPAAGNITLNAPAGYLIWTTGTPANSLSIPYTGGALNVVINVKYTATKYGYSNDSITCSGGGAIAPNAQTLTLKALGTQALGTANNSGIDFWTGFGFVEEMSNNKANMSVYIAAGDQDATVNVDIPGLNWSYTLNPITIPAHTVYEVNGFPTTTPDARLYYTGVSNRAVHIQSANGVPVAAWTYTSATDNTAAGCMNIPSNTWSSDYIVQSFGGYSNSPYPNSYFFVIAKDDNTSVTIIPSADIVDSNASTIFKDNTASYVKYPANVPFTVNLNKGQVFTGLSILTGTGSGINGTKALSADLSGTKVSSNSTNKIAVFGGNGRCIVDTSVTHDSASNFQTVRATTGSDNLMQQMIPSTAWGTKYLTLPTKTMEDNYYRVYVQDTSANVTVNGVLLSKNTLVKNLYYQLSGSNISNGDIRPYDLNGNHFLEINSDKAISVCQFIVSGAISGDKNPLAANIGNNGKGDPEMIIISPIQQAINSVTVATPNFKNGAAGGNYINVVIPKAGIRSFKIYSDTTTISWHNWKHITDSSQLPFNPTDTSNTNNYAYKLFNDTTAMLVDTGASSYIVGAAYASSNTLVYLDSAFIPYPTDSNYYFARFKVRMLNTYTMTSNVGFNAIAYGMDAGESYGFNAGTNIKDLSSPSTTISISGNIKHPSNGNLIPSVTSNMTGSSIQSMVGTGNYTFSNLPSNSSVKIKLTKNNDKTKANGVSTIDAALIQSHVLGKALLNSPYKIIAADVNGDDKVSALDIVFLKRLILGLDTTFAKGTEKRMWVFVDSNYTFSAPTSPFPYKDSINFAGLSVSKTNQTFLGMKLGDVNWDWNQAIAKPYNQKVNAVELSYNADAMETSSHYVRIPVMVKNFKEMMGMQFTLSFNADLLKYKGMEGNMLSIETGTNHTNEGKLSMLWLDPKNELKTLEDGTQLMVLVFENIGKEAIGKEAIGNTIELDGSITSMEAFDKDYNLHGLIMKPITTNLSDKKEFIVIAPNPVTDGNINVQMQLSQNKTLTIRLVDIAGRIIFENKVEGSKGLNSFILNSNKKNKLTTGEYYLQVIGIDGSTIKKIMIQ